GRRDIQYQFPDRYSCTTCHGEAPGEVIALRTPQLNGTYDYDGVRANQLEALASISVFEPEVEPIPAEFASQPDPLDEDAGLEPRARSYLDVHCASCHQPGGWTPSEINMDLRFETPLEETFVCNELSLYPYP